MHRLRQSTATQRFPLGPFVDETDGFTLENALGGGTIAASDLKLWKHGATTGVNASAGAAFDVDGTYVLTLDATDTNTLGNLVVVATPAGARPMRFTAEVLPAVIFDSLLVNFGFAADVKAIGANAAVVARLANALDTVPYGLTSSTIPCTQTSVTFEHVIPGAQVDPVPTETDQWKGKVLVFTGLGSNTPGNRCVGRRIIGHNNAAPFTFTTEAFPSQPATLNMAVILDAEVAKLTADGYVQADIQQILGSAQAALLFKRMALAASTGTLAAGSTQTVLQISGAMTPALAGNDQVRGRVVLIVDEAGSQATLKLQGGKVFSCTTTSITLETPLTAVPAAGNVIIVL